MTKKDALGVVEQLVTITIRVKEGLSIYHIWWAGTMQSVQTSRRAALKDARLVRDQVVKILTGEERNDYHIHNGDRLTGYSIKKFLAKGRKKRGPFKNRSARL